MAKKHWCDECGIVAVEGPYEVCATCNYAFDWDGMCLACCNGEPEQRGCVYCNECIALLAGLSMEEACTSCFGAPREEGSIYCTDCFDNPYVPEDSLSALDDDEYYMDEYGYGFDRWGGYGSSWYQEPAVREVPPINEELETFARAS